MLCFLCIRPISIAIASASPLSSSITVSPLLYSSIIYILYMSG